MRFGSATTMVVAGYKLDPAAESIDDVRIVCPYRDGLAWWFSILSDGSEEQYEFEPSVDPQGGPRFQVRVSKTSGR